MLGSLAIYSVLIDIDPVLCVPMLPHQTISAPGPPDQLKDMTEVCLFINLQVTLLYQLMLSKFKKS